MSREARAAYRRFLQSRFWKDIATEQKTIHPKCQECGSPKRLQAHHIRYPNNWFETTLDDLKTLCRKCHDKAHGIERHFFMMFGGRTKEECAVFHRCSCLSDRIMAGGFLRERDRRFLMVMRKKYKPTKNDGAIRLHIDQVLERERLWKEVCTRKTSMRIKEITP